MGTAMALFRRERTGEGEEVDVALYEPLLFIVADVVLRYQALGDVQGRVGNGTGSASPRGVYQAGDGSWLAIAASNQVIALRLFVPWTGRTSAPTRAMPPTSRGWSTTTSCRDRDGWVAARSRGEILDILERHEVVASPVNDARDIVEDPHFRERSLVELTGNAVLGSRC